MSSYAYAKVPIKYSKNSNFLYKPPEKKKKSVKYGLDTPLHKKPKLLIPLYYRANSKYYLKSSVRYGLIGAGILLLTVIVFPIALYYVDNSLLGKFTQSFISTVPTSEAQASSFAGISNPFNVTYNPDAAYFQKAVNATNNNAGKIDTNYSGYFSLSIPSIGIQDIKVKANVDSSNNNYLSVLENSVAQFKGTALPGEDGNVFIYGHSSIEWYHNLFKNSYIGIFTDLSNVNIGDTVTVNFKGKKYVYQIYSTQIVSPADLSVLKATPGEKTLTLMTCEPPGIGSERLIVKAQQEN